MTTVTIVNPSCCDLLAARRHARRRAASDELTEVDERAGRLRTRAGRNHAALRRLVLERIPCYLEDLMRGSGHAPGVYQAVADELVERGYVYASQDGWLLPSWRLVP